MKKITISFLIIISISFCLTSCGINRGLLIKESYSILNILNVLNTQLDSLNNVIDSLKKENQTLKYKK